MDNGLRIRELRQRVREALDNKSDGTLKWSSHTLRTLLINSALCQRETGAFAEEIKEDVDHYNWLTQDVKILKLVEDLAESLELLIAVGLLTARLSSEGAEVRVRERMIGPASEQEVVD